MGANYSLVNKTLVDGIDVKDLHRGSCHCGAIVFEVKLQNGLEDPRRCNCSMCRRRGAIVASVELANLKIIQGEESLSLYQFNTNTAKHFFCSKCGIYTHHQRRSNPGLYAFNIACLDDVDPFILKSVPTYDGENHPGDQ